MSTEKKIEQYLHLYIGCEVEYEGILNGKEMCEELKANKHDVFYIPQILPVKGKKIGILKSIDVDMDGNYRRARIGRKGLQSHWGKANFKPRLSKLEDMTPEDLQECGNMVYDFSDDPELNNHKPEDFQVCAPEQFRFLIKKGYWLFGNDWFDEGIIIDKKTFK